MPLHDLIKQHTPQLQRNWIDTNIMTMVIMTIFTIYRYDCDVLNHLMHLHLFKIRQSSLRRL